MVTWSAPTKQVQRGCHAWHEWNYEIVVKPFVTVNISKSMEEEGIRITNITETSYLFNREMTRLENSIDTFSFVVRAKSSSGMVSSLWCYKD